MRIGFSFNDIYDSDFDLVCRPGYDLAKAHRVTKRVPSSFIISSELFDKLVSDKESISRDYFAKTSLPEEFLSELEEFYFALPSSSLLEEDNPVVNIYLSPSYKSSLSIPERAVLYVSGFNDFLSGIKTCYSKLFSEKEVRHRKNIGVKNFTSALIVQVFKPYLASIEAGYSEEGISLSSYKGLPDITGGVAKDVSFCNPGSVEIENTVVGSQEFKLVEGEYSSELFKYYLKSNAYDKKVDDVVLSEAVRICKRLSLGSNVNCLFGTDGSNLDVLYVEGFREESNDDVEEYSVFKKNDSDIATAENLEEPLEEESDFKSGGEAEEDVVEDKVFEDSSGVVDDSEDEESDENSKVVVDSDVVDNEINADEYIDTDVVISSEGDFEDDSNVKKTISENSGENLDVSLEKENASFDEDEDVISVDLEKSYDEVDEDFIDSAIKEYQEEVEFKPEGEIQESSEVLEGGAEDKVIEYDSDDSSEDDDFLFDGVGDGVAESSEDENKRVSEKPSSLKFLEEEFDVLISAMYKESFGSHPDGVEQAILDLDMKYGFKDIDKLLTFKREKDESLADFIRDFIERSK